MTIQQVLSRSSQSSWHLHDVWLTLFLDDVQKRLPTPADHLFGMQRSMRRLGYSVLSNLVRTVGDSVDTVLSTGRTGARTVAGQARSAVERTVETGATGTKEVLGQARAQAERTVSTAEAEIDVLADHVETSGSARDFDQWTRADLYSRAQDVKIKGRSGMNKNDLVAALRTHYSV